MVGVNGQNGEAVQGLQRIVIVGYNC